MHKYENIKDTNMKIPNNFLEIHPAAVVELSLLPVGTSTCLCRFPWNKKYRMKNWNEYRKLNLENMVGIVQWTPATARIF